MKCELWNPHLETRALAFLQERYASSLFLLSNFAGFGSTLGEHPNSGNFRILLDGERVTAVFALTRRGNLTVSGEAHPLILSEARKDAIPITGVIGGWEIASAVWQELGSSTCSFSSKEFMYQLSELPPAGSHPAVRFLTAEDFNLWRPIRRAYLAEEGLTIDIPEEQLRENFVKYTAAREHWGLFEKGRLVSVTALNAVALGIGQVGGVYTEPSERGRGLSSATMLQMLRDCGSVHRLTKMLLFTGQNNIAAQKVYERLGFARIGWFGLFFV
jgi:predicted GNAT family acetyltransferase